MSDTSVFRKGTAAVRPWQSLASLGITESDLTTVHHLSVVAFPRPSADPGTSHHRAPRIHRKHKGA
ncbi:hypothetical protein ABZ865_41570 [Streptomyces sp. NPDC047085]|uniref:hypothetical protein n=1 Tax=Streptomyces sp. NPDC047085 TaxID=3155140 RepID=UPI0033C92283